LPSGEGQLAALGVDHDGVALGQVAGEQAPGQLVADCLGYQPPPRPGPVGRVVAAVGQPGLGGRGQLEGEPTVGQPCRQPGDLEVDDPGQLVAAEAVEDQDLVQPVGEPGLEA